MAESQPERVKKQIDKSHRQVLTFTINNIAQRVEELFNGGKERSYSHILYHHEEKASLILALTFSPHDRRLLQTEFSLKIDPPFFSVKVTSSILNSNDEPEQTKETVTIPKDNSAVRFYYGMIMPNCQDDIDRLFPNDTLTILYEIDIFYKFSFKNYEGMTMEYISKLSSSITFLEKYDQITSGNAQYHRDTRVILNEERKRYMANEKTLSFYSTVFSSMLNDDTEREEGNKIISIEDMDKDVATVLLDYLHGIQISNKSIEFIAELFSAANRYAVFDLKRYCAAILTSNLKLENVRKFRLLEEGNEDKLYDAVKSFVNENFSELMISQVLATYPEVTGVIVHT